MSEYEKNECRCKHEREKFLCRQRCEDNNYCASDDVVRVNKLRYKLISSEFIKIKI